MPGNVVVLLKSEDGRALVRQKCRAAGIKIAVFEELISAELDQQGKKRKAGLWEEFDAILDAESQDEVS